LVAQARNHWVLNLVVGLGHALVDEAELSEVRLADGFCQFISLAEVVLDYLPLLPLEVEESLVDDGIEHDSLGRDANSLGELSLLLAYARLVLPLLRRGVRAPVANSWRSLLVDFDIDLADGRMLGEAIHYEPEGCQRRIASLHPHLALAQLLLGSVRVMDL